MFSNLNILKTKIALLAASLLFSKSVMSAEISINNCDSCLPYSGFIEIKGYLNDGDLERSELRDFQLPADSGLVYVVVLQSEGGSIKEAMRIGRHIRRLKLGVMVPEKASCLSACVLILSAGSMKWPYGIVGVHRPFFTEEKLDVTAKTMRDLEYELKAYVKEIGISESFVDFMMSIPPEDMRIMTKSELAYYRLDQSNIEDSEVDAINQSRRLGISRLEYNERLSKMKSSGKLEYCQSLEADRQFECLLEVAATYGLLFKEIKPLK